MADKTILTNGIDVSYANGKLDWSKMKKKTDFVIIRCGYGGDYKNQDDAQFINNISGCEKNGIPYGVYLYSYATNEAKAESEASHAIRLLKGHKPEYPVFLDLEESRISSLGKAAILAIAKRFCERITDAGYRYGTYANKNWFTNYLTDKWYDSYPKWIAQYNSSVTYSGTYDIWQYTSSGKIDGFNGRFDFNRCYTSFKKGDVSGDGNVTVSDARTILREAVGLEKLEGQSEINADVDSDGEITVTDARKALREAAGLDNE